ncbi:hypothetical protein NCC49_002696, partial [Naganishia albida]
ERPPSTLAGGAPPPPRLTELPYVPVSGKKVSYAPVPDDQLYAILQPFGGDRAAGCVVEMYKGIREVGYYGGDDLAPSNAHLAEPARTFLQALEARPEVIKKIFGGQA